MMATIPVAEIPTLSLLYRLGKLVPATFETNKEALQPSQSFNGRVGVLRTDITRLEVDAIVNAANNSLLGGGGVDGAIHRAAGPGLLDETEMLDGCDTGSAKITGAYELPCKKVIHAVGPVYKFSFKERCEKKLASCYKTSLELAVQNGCKSVAFSAISTGVYGYPSDAAANVAVRTVKEFLESKDGDELEMIVFCTFMPKDVDAYNKWLPRFFPSTEVELDNDWEEIEAGESADNGPAVENADSADGEAQTQAEAETAKAALPDVPAIELAEEGHAAKKAKPSELD